LELVLPKNVPASDIMTKNPITVGPLSSVQDAQRIFRSRHIGGLPVVENGKLIGMFALSDLRKVVPGKGGSTKVSDVMAKDVFVAGPNESLDRLLDAMSTRRIGRIPIVAGDGVTLLGIVSYSDLKEVSKIHAPRRGGSPEVIALKCPNGHPLPIPTSRIMKCEYCGETLFLKL